MRMTFWRWHFYAGLLCIPIVLLLSVTGMIYLFKPQIDNLIDYRYDHLAPLNHPHDPAREVAAALAAVPGGTFLGYELPRTARSAVRVLVDQRGAEIRVFVDPSNFHVLKTIPESARFERIIFKLHGSLLLGNAGSVIVELTASWAIVLILTGLALWLPAPLQAGGLLYPRFGAKGRRFWRDLHGVFGMWASMIVLFLLISGLPWSFAWGNYLKELRAVAGAKHKIDWPVGAVSPRGEIASAEANMQDMPMMTLGAPTKPAPASSEALANVVSEVGRLHLAYPVVVMPPRPGHRDWSAMSNAQDRVLRTTVKLSSKGKILSRIDFDQRPLIDRAVGFGVAVHEGRLFGPLNVAMNMFAALSLIIVCTSGVAMWWRRRPASRLGAPPARNSGVSASVVAAIVVLCLGIPLFCLSLGLVWLTERLVLRRIAPVADWLGLSAT
jgi:uncharacterized iron-regulated membrane protein